MKRQHMLIVILGLVITPTLAAPPEGERKGLIRNESGAYDGYTLFAPLRSTKTYLIDMQGRVVHTWTDEFSPGHSVYLLDNGDLLRCARDPRDNDFHGGGIGGRVRRLDWDGNLVWEFDYADENHCQHHDIEPLPNGNVLILAWEKKTNDAAIAAGRDPELLSGGELWPDHVIEVQPKGRRGGKIVWEWHVWDHLVQDFDKTKANFGIVEDHPELIDINFVGQSMQLAPEEKRRLQALGYIGGKEPQERDPRRRGGPGPGKSGADWNHTNSIAYNAELDQIVLSVLGFNEIWIIDHGTTTEQAAGHVGGRYGKGGDLLYRWGNPQAYRADGASDQQLFAQHDARWIPDGSPGGGHILVFNNGRGRPGEQYTSIDEIVTPLNKSGAYTIKAGGAYGPDKSSWSYTSPSKTDFYASHISGAQRLPNGNTLICSGEEGRLFEVTLNGEVVWEYASPFGGEIGPPGPRHRGGPPPGPNRVDDRRGPRPRRGPPGGRDEANAVFRATRLAPNHPGLQHRDLSGADTEMSHHQPKEPSGSTTGGGP